MDPEDFHEALAKVARFLAITIATISLFLVRAGKAVGSALGRFIPRAYRHIRTSVVAFVDSGWRKAWGWLGPITGAFAYVYAPLNHIAIADYGAVNLFLGYCTATYTVRGAEKMASIGALRIPSLTDVMNSFTPAPAEGRTQPAPP